MGQTSPCGAVRGAYAIRPYSLIPDRFRIRFATSLSKTRRVSLRHVAKSKTRRVLRYVVWQSPKPAGFYAMSCGRVQNPPGFTLCRVAKSKIRRVLRYVVWRNAKPIGRQAVGAYCIRPLGVFGRRRMIDTENRRFFLALIIFFSSLDGRKGAKEDQGLTEAGEVSRVQVGVEKQVGCTGVGAYCIRPLGVFDRKRMIDIKKEVFFLAFMFFFSCLDTRKEAKEDQGLTEAGEFGRVQVGTEKRPEN